MNCETCVHSVKANVLWMWLCGYGQSLKEKYVMKVLLCEAGKLPEKPTWCPLGAVGPDESKVQGV